LADRACVIAALGCVDLVTWFDQDTPLNLIQLITPEWLVKGGDWPQDSIVGADWVKAAGGQVVSIPFEHARSTTALLQKIRHA
jgi:rfaE bifunctional protein nucleotidyltransferase chain/domain